MNLKSLKPEMGFYSFGLLHSVFWWWLIDVSEQPIGLFFMGLGLLEP
jgi:hypothetical protein